MTTADNDPQLQAYFSEAAGWDGDRVEQSRRQARTAWRVAAVASICALSASVALGLLLPLKRVDPFVIRVDNSTGIVDVVPVYTGQAPLDEAVTRYFLTHYISVCERFNLATAESDYEECGAFHSAPRNQAWYALWNPANPLSPLNLHRDGSEVLAQVQSVSFFKRANGVGDMAQVRYLTAERTAAGAPQHVSHWVGTIQYTYSAPSADPRVRRWNPLGFRLLEFVAEPELVGEQAVAGGAPSAAAAAAGDTPKAAVP